MKGGIDMKTSNAEQLFKEPSVRKETFKVPDSISSFPHVSPARGEERVVNCFNSLLANEFALFTKTLNFHWNVTGPRFHSVHQFLDDQYHELLKVVDNVAERIREIGGNPMGTLTELQKANSLVERPGVQPETSNMIADLMSDHESIQIQIKAILKEIDRGESDPGSEDFLTTLLKKHEEMAWMLKSHIEE
jgi:starvation-inducible DNA-binding protein